jgi:uncharacterized protein (TIGR03083 family)
MKTKEIWSYIHGERERLVETLGGLSTEQWASPSWCAGWTVQDTVGHIVAAAEQTPANFYKELVSAGFRFNVFTERGAKRLGALRQEELVRRLQERTSTTNHPPAPVMAMLGEIVVHGEDIRRPLGVRRHQAPEAALVALADSWKKSNLLIGAKRRIAGLRLRASDVHWVHGDGPEVTGPLNSLVLAMVGRKGAHDDLSGEGLATLGNRP